MGSRRGSIKPGLFGIFSYFSQIDTDGSGFLELNEIEGKIDLWRKQRLNSSTAETYKSLQKKFQKPLL